MYRSAAKTLSLLLTIGLFSSTLGDSSEKWTYDRDDTTYGPSAWGNNFHECSLTKNSPINIVKEDAVRRTPEPWTLTGWDASATWTVLDTNYTVKYSLEEGHSIKTQGGDLGTYEVLQFHLHWGKSDNVGSEHTYNGKSFPMEIHFVHRNGVFTVTEEAIQSEEDDALGVLGFFFQLQADDNPHLAKLVQGVKETREADDQTVDSYTLNPPEDFVADAMKGNFYRYYGGLTTPGCNQIVKWTVFETPIGVSAAQMDVIRNSTSREYGVDYFRDPQSVGGRLVTLYDQDCTEITCGAPATLAPLALIFLSVISKYF